MHSRGDLVGTELEGRYRILSRLGEGGMGTVYVAQHLGLGSRCAVKVLRSELGASATARERFLREARIASQLGERNPHIVKVMDLGCLPDGSGFYAMEWLQGEELDLDACLRFAADRDAYTAAHLLVRACAGALLGVPASSVGLEQQCPRCGGVGHGRPSIAGEPGVFVSLSHTRGYVAAVAATAEANTVVAVERMSAAGA